MNDLEIKNNQKVDRNDLQLRQLIQNDFGIPRGKFKTKHRDRLAKMAKVDGKDEKYVGSFEQNLRIRQKILDNQTLPLHEYPESLNKFIHAKTIKEAFTDEKISAYISNLSKDQIDMLNLLSPPQLIAFIEKELKGVEDKKISIKQKMNINVSDATVDQIANLSRLMDLQERLDDFIAKYKINELIVDKKTRKFVDENAEEKFQAFLTESKKQEEYKKLIEKYGASGADEYLRTAYIFKNVKDTDSYKKLSDTQKAELAGELTDMVVDFAIQSQGLNIDLSSFKLEELYIMTREYFTDTYGETEQYRALMNNIHIDPDMNTFFKEEKNSITELGPEKEKDKAYYDKLCLRYPEFNAITKDSDMTIQDYLKYFNDDMTIKSDISDKEKIQAKEFLEKLPTFAKPYDERLVRKTNGIVQEFAVSQCIESLQNYMDINISEKENLMEQLKVLEDKDAISNQDGELLLKVQGMRNDKKMTLSYDLLSGKVYYHPFLYKKSFNDTDPLTLGQDNDRNRLPLTTIASISTILQGVKEGSKNGDYLKLAIASDDLDTYVANIKEDMDGKMTSGETIGYEIGQDMLKKQIIQDEIVQNVVAITGRIMKDKEEITLQYANIYGFYNYLYKSLEYYSMYSVDKLVLFNTNIKKLLGYRNAWSGKSVEDVMKYKEGVETSAVYQNDEMFAIQALVNKEIVPLYTNVFTEQRPEERMMKFFKCFKQEKGGLEIMDVDKMDDYLIAAAGTNNKENIVEKRKRDDDFRTMVTSMQEVLGKKSADENLAAQLEDVYLPKNLPETEK